MARSLSIELFALGIGDGINEDELLVIAGSQDRVFRIDNFTNINDASALIAQGSCKCELFIIHVTNSTIILHVSYMFRYKFWPMYIYKLKVT